AVSKGVAKSKLCLILPVNGYDWPSGGSGKELGRTEAFDLAMQYAVTWQRDAEGDPHFTYTTGGKVHEVWAEDNQSLQAKTNLLVGMGVNRVGLWSLEQGDPAFWTWLAQPTEPPAPKPVPPDPIPAPPDPTPVPPDPTPAPPNPTPPPSTEP